MAKIMNRGDLQNRVEKIQISLLQTSLPPGVGGRSSGPLPPSCAQAFRIFSHYESFFCLTHADYLLKAAPWRRFYIFQLLRRSPRKPPLLPSAVKRCRRKVCRAPKGVFKWRAKKKEHPNIGRRAFCSRSSLCQQRRHLVTHVAFVQRAWQAVSGNNIGKNTFFQYHLIHQRRERKKTKGLLCVRPSLDRSFSATCVTLIFSRAVQLLFHRVDFHCMYCVSVMNKSRLYISKYTFHQVD